MFKRFFRGVNKKEAISWALYYFGCHAYSLMIISFVFSIYFKNVIAGVNGDFWWGAVISISVLLGGIAAPVIGAIADYDSRRKIKFVIISVLAMIGTAALFFTGSGLLLFSALIFIATNLIYQLALMFNDSFLMHVSNDKTAGRISGLGYGMGYLGGVIALLLLRPLYVNGFTGGNLFAYKLTFPLTALFFLVFSIPAFIYLKEKKVKKKGLTLWEMTKIGFGKVFTTLKEVRKHKRIAWFLVASYILNDALVTLFAFIPIYANTTLSLSFSEITVIFLVIQLIGFPAAIFFGWLSDKKGQKRVLLFTILVWILVIILASVASSKMMFYAVAVLAGCVIGSSQAIARSWFTMMIPKEKRVQFFGFNILASEIAATTGPIIFGTISALTGSQRIAMAALLPYFIISFIIFYRLKEK